jgi:hypothetical protein
LNNAGIVEVQGGSLTIGGGSTSTGSFLGAPGTLIDFGGGVLTLTPSARVIAFSLLLDPATLNVQVSGSPSGAVYPVVIVGNSASVGGQLNVQVLNSFTPYLGQTFTTIQNQGSSAVSGTFAGQTVTDNQGNIYQINYRGGVDGNDVTLTTIFVVNTPPSANAGDPYTMTYGGGLTLNASASSDPDGDPLSYAWTINGHANAAVGVKPILTWAQLQALGVNTAQPFTVSVFVNDGYFVVPSAAVTVTVNKANPVVTWNNPADIAYGTALGPSQLDATANVAGSFAYSAAAGTVLPVGNGQTLSVTFTPNDTVDYTTAIQTVTLNVLKAPTATALVASINPSALNQAVTFTATVTSAAGSGTPTGTVQFQIDGVNAGAAVSLTSGSASFSTATLTVGTDIITAIYSGDGSYLGFTGSLTETVLSAQQEITVIGNQVNNLVNAGLLSSGNGNALTAKLSSATASLTGSHTNAAVNQLKAFINQVSTFVQSGTLPSAEGQALISAAKAAITAASGSGSFQLASASSSDFVSSNSNQILSGVLTVAVQDDTGNGLDTSEVARLNDAVAYLNDALGSFGVYLSWAAAGTAADVHIHFSSSTPEGGASDGVLGFTTADNNVYFVTGWNFYTGLDPSAIGADQYDFLTLATHELAHTVGLGESSDPNSVMYEYLAPGTVRRTFTDANLALINTDADRFMKVDGVFQSAGDRDGLTHPRWLAGALDELPSKGNVGISSPAAATLGLPAGTLLTWLLATRPALGDGVPPAGGAFYLASGGNRVLLAGTGDALRLGGPGRDQFIGGFASERRSDQANGSEEAEPTPLQKDVLWLDRLAVTEAKWADGLWTSVASDAGHPEPVKGDSVWDRVPSFAFDEAALQLAVLLTGTAHDPVQRPEGPK